MVVLRLFRTFIPRPTLCVRNLIIDMAYRIIVLQTRQLHWMVPLQVDKASVGQPRDPIARLAFAEPGPLQ
jgi:hypothetical protein